MSLCHGGLSATDLVDASTWNPYKCNDSLTTKVSAILGNIPLLHRVLWRLKGPEQYLILVTTVTVAWFAAAVASMYSRRARRLYATSLRTALLVGTKFAAKVSSIIMLVIYKDAPPSTYCKWYLPVEGLVIVWQALVAPVGASTQAILAAADAACTFCCCWLLSDRWPYSRASTGTVLAANLLLAFCSLFIAERVEKAERRDFPAALAAGRRRHGRRGPEVERELRAEADAADGGVPAARGGQDGGSKGTVQEGQDGAGPVVKRPARAGGAPHGDCGATDAPSRSKVVTLAAGPVCEAAAHASVAEIGLPGELHHPGAETCSACSVKVGPSPGMLDRAHSAAAGGQDRTGGASPNRPSARSATSFTEEARSPPPLLRQPHPQLRPYSHHLPALVQRLPLLNGTTPSSPPPPLLRQRCRCSLDGVSPDSSSCACGDGCSCPDSVAAAAAAAAAAATERKSTGRDCARAMAIGSGSCSPGFTSGSRSLSRALPSFSTNSITSSGFGGAGSIATFLADTGLSFLASRPCSCVMSQAHARLAAQAQAPGQGGAAQMLVPVRSPSGNPAPGAAAAGHLGAFCGGGAASSVAERDNNVGPDGAGGWTAFCSRAAELVLSNLEVPPVPAAGDDATPDVKCRLTGGVDTCVPGAETGVEGGGEIYAASARGTAAASGVAQAAGTGDGGDDAATNGAIVAAVATAGEGQQRYCAQDAAAAEHDPRRAAPQEQREYANSTLLPAGMQPESRTSRSSAPEVGRSSGGGALRQLQRLVRSLIAGGEGAAAVLAAAAAAAGPSEGLMGHSTNSSGGGAAGGAVHSPGPASQVQSCPSLSPRLCSYHSQEGSASSCASVTTGLVAGAGIELGTAAGAGGSGGGTGGGSDWAVAGAVANAAAMAAAAAAAVRSGGTLLLSSDAVLLPGCNSLPTALLDSSAAGHFRLVCGGGNSNGMIGCQTLSADMLSPEVREQLSEFQQEFQQEWLSAGAAVAEEDCQHKIGARRTGAASPVGVRAPRTSFAAPEAPALQVVVGDTPAGEADGGTSGEAPSAAAEPVGAEREDPAETRDVQSGPEGQATKATRTWLTSEAAMAQGQARAVQQPASEASPGFQRSQPPSPCSRDASCVSASACGCHSPVITGRAGAVVAVDGRPRHMQGRAVRTTSSATDCLPTVAETAAADSSPAAAESVPAPGGRSPLRFFALARALAARGGANAVYDSPALAHSRCSIKLSGLSPADLPPGLAGRVGSMIAGLRGGETLTGGGGGAVGMGPLAAVGVYVREGCVEVVVDVVVPVAGGGPADAMVSAAAAAAAAAAGATAAVATAAAAEAFPDARWAPATAQMPGAGADLAAATPPPPLEMHASRRLLANLPGVNSQAAVALQEQQQRPPAPEHAAAEAMLSLLENTLLPRTQGSPLGPLPAGAGLVAMQATFGGTQMGLRAPPAGVLGNLNGTRPLLPPPSILLVSPCCISLVHPSDDDTRDCRRQTVTLTVVLATHVAATPRVLVRHSGRCLAAAVEPAAPVFAGTAAVTVQIPLSGLRPGVLFLEAASEAGGGGDDGHGAGSVLSHPWPVVVVADPRVAVEVLQLQSQLLAATPLRAAQAGALAAEVMYPSLCANQHPRLQHQPPPPPQFPQQHQLDGGALSVLLDLGMWFDAVSMPDAVVIEAATVAASERASSTAVPTMAGEGAEAQQGLNHALGSISASAALQAAMLSAPLGLSSDAPRSHQQQQQQQQQLLVESRGAASVQVGAAPAAGPEADAGQGAESEVSDGSWASSAAGSSRAPSPGASPAPSDDEGSHGSCGRTRQSQQHRQLDPSRRGLSRNRQSPEPLPAPPAPVAAVAAAAAAKYGTTAAGNVLAAAVPACGGGANGDSDGGEAQLALLRALQPSAELLDGSLDCSAEYEQLCRRGAALQSAASALGLRLLRFAVARGWPAVGTLVLKGLLAHCGLTFADVAALFPAAGGEGLPLLHTAVMSGRLAMVRAVVSWAQRCRQPLRWDESAGGEAGGGLTPLHLAAVLEDSGRMAGAILGIWPEAEAQWAVARDMDGRTPQEYAYMRAMSTNASSASQVAVPSAAGGGVASPPRPTAALMLAASGASATAAAGGVGIWGSVSISGSASTSTAASACGSGLSGRPRGLEDPQQQLRRQLAGSGTGMTSESSLRECPTPLGAGMLGVAPITGPPSAAAASTAAAGGPVILFMAPRDRERVCALAGNSWRQQLQSTLPPHVAQGAGGQPQLISQASTTTESACVGSAAGRGEGPGSGISSMYTSPAAVSYQAAGFGRFDRNSDCGSMSMGPDSQWSHSTNVTAHTYFQPSAVAHDLRPASTPHRPDAGTVAMTLLSLANLPDGSGDTSAASSVTAACGVEQAGPHQHPQQQHARVLHALPPAVLASIAAAAVAGTLCVAPQQAPLPQHYHSVRRQPSERRFRSQASMEHQHSAAAGRLDGRLSPRALQHISPLRQQQQQQQQRPRETTGAGQRVLQAPQAAVVAAAYGPVGAATGASDPAPAPTLAAASGGAVSTAAASVGPVAGCAQFGREQAGHEQVFNPRALSPAAASPAEGTSWYEEEAGWRAQAGAGAGSGDGIAAAAGSNGSAGDAIPLLPPGLATDARPALPAVAVEAAAERALVSTVQAANVLQAPGAVALAAAGPEGTALLGAPSIGGRTEDRQAPPTHEGRSGDAAGVAGRAAVATGAGAPGEDAVVGPLRAGSSFAHRAVNPPLPANAMLGSTAAAAAAAVSADPRGGPVTAGAAATSASSSAVPAVATAVNGNVLGVACFQGLAQSCTISVASSTAAMSLNSAVCRRLSGDGRPPGSMRRFAYADDYAPLCAPTVAARTGALERLLSSTAASEAAPGAADQARASGAKTGTAAPAGWAMGRQQGLTRAVATATAAPPAIVGSSPQQAAPLPAPVAMPAGAGGSQLSASAADALAAAATSAPPLLPMPQQQQPQQKRGTAPSDQQGPVAVILSEPQTAKGSSVDVWDSASWAAARRTAAAAVAPSAATQLAAPEEAGDQVQESSAAVSTVDNPVRPPGLARAAAFPQSTAATGTDTAAGGGGGGLRPDRLRGGFLAAVLVMLLAVLVAVVFGAGSRGTGLSAFSGSDSPLLQPGAPAAALPAAQ